MKAQRPRPTRNASGLIHLLDLLGWSGSSAAKRLGISHPTLIGLRDQTNRPGQVVIDTVVDHLREAGYHVTADTLFPRDDKPQEESRGPLTIAAG